MNRLDNKVIIGIVMHKNSSEYGYLQSINDEYRRSVVRSGATPIGICSTQDILIDDTKPSELPKMNHQEKSFLIDSLLLCDGIILTGGDMWYEYDEFICRFALENKIPLLGICMGMQVMNAVDTRTSVSTYSRLVKNESTVNHSLKGEKYAHTVNVNSNSKLFNIIGENKITVNSNHNYHVESLNNFKTSAISEDGYIEAIELLNHPFAIGVQWHPEKMTDYDINSKKLFEGFINTCKTIKENKIVK